MRLNWFSLKDENKLRYSFHITDAPPHGSAFTGEGEDTDCKCGKKMKPIL